MKMRSFHNTMRVAFAAPLMSLFLVLLVAQQPHAVGAWKESWDTVQCPEPDSEICVGEAVLYGPNFALPLECLDDTTYWNNNPELCQYGYSGGWSWEFKYVVGLPEGAPSIYEAENSEFYSGVTMKLVLDDDRTTCSVAANSQNCASCEVCEFIEFGESTFSADCTNLQNGRQIVCEQLAYLNSMDALFYPFGDSRPSDSSTESPTTQSPTTLPPIVPEAPPTGSPTGSPTPGAPTLGDPPPPEAPPTGAPTESPTTRSPTTEAPTAASHPSVPPATGSPTDAPSTRSPDTFPTKNPTQDKVTTDSPSGATATATDAPTVGPVPTSDPPTYLRTPSPSTEGSAATTTTTTTPPQPVKILPIDAHLVFDFFKGTGRQPTEAEIQSLLQEMTKFFTERLQGSPALSNFALELTNIIPHYDATGAPDEFKLEFETHVTTLDGQPISTKETMHAVNELIGESDFRDFLVDNVREVGGVFFRTFKVFYQGVSRGDGGGDNGNEDES